MHCPKCGAENPDDAKSCCSCGKELVTTVSVEQESAEKISTLAIISLTSGILSIAITFLPLGQLRTLKGSVLSLTSLSGVLALIPAVIGITLGIVALVKIIKSANKLKGKRLAKTGIVLSAIWLFLLFLYIPSTSCVIYGIDPPQVSQQRNFHSMGAALELFYHEFDGYPPSKALDPTGKPYCGAIKLCEATLGQDLLGFHTQSVYRADGKDANGIKLLYPESADPCNLKFRKGPFLPPEGAYVHRLKDIYEDVRPFDEEAYVMCDVFVKTRHSGKRTGMPVLYYKADTSKTVHNLENPDDPNNIYNYKDNYALLSLGVPSEPNIKHPLFANPKLFYEMFRSKKITTQSRPHRADSYILLSAGYDGLYGTKDDIVNFEMLWKPK